MNIETRQKYLNGLSVLLLLYIFLVGVKCLSAGLKMMGSGFAQALFDSTSSPGVALVAGILGTVLFQSSSVSTSIVVGLVGSGMLSVGNAVPMIMGANIGTSVTNTIVSLGFVQDKKNFKRAFAAATVHDFFNFLSVLIFLPLEIATGFIESTANSLSTFFYGTESVAVEFNSPIKMVLKPMVGVVKSMAHLMGESMAPTLMVILAGVIILAALTLIVKQMNKVLSPSEGQFLEKVLSKNIYVTVLFGIFITIAAQSSSITTSILVPLAGSGVLSLPIVYAVTVGANIGTTTTALLAALAGPQAGLTIAFVHLIFNLSGTILFFVITPMRQFPIQCASTLARLIDVSKIFGLLYIAFVFIGLPALFLYFA